MKLLYRSSLATWAALLVLLGACGVSPPSVAAPTALPTRSPAAERAKGDPHAPVTLIEYGDYQ